MQDENEARQTAYLSTKQVTSDAVDELEERLRAINSLADVARATRSSVPLDYVLGIGGFDLGKVDDAVSGGASAPADGGPA